jgi:hypothetical protein
MSTAMFLFQSGFTVAIVTSLGYGWATTTGKSFRNEPLHVRLSCLGGLASVTLIAAAILVAMWVAP